MGGWVEGQPPSFWWAPILHKEGNRYFPVLHIIQCPQWVIKLYVLSYFIIHLGLITSDKFTAICADFFLLVSDPVFLQVGV